MPQSSETTLPPSIQAKLDLGDTEMRPLGDVNTAMRDLNLDSEEVRLLVQLGYLVALTLGASAGPAPPPPPAAAAAKANCAF